MGSDRSLLELARLYWDRDLRQVPADVGLLRHGEFHVATRADYYHYILGTLVNVEDAYFPFYTPLVSKYWEQKRKDGVMVDRIFVDIDVRGKDTFADIWERAVFFAERFWNNVELFFSAGKGFHFYIHINPTPYGELHKHRDELFWNLGTWLQYLHDKRVFISLDRICRITLTKHSVDPENSTPIRWKIPVDPSMSIKEILRESQFPQNFVNEFYRLYARKLEPIDWKTFLKSPDTLL